MVTVFQTSRIERARTGFAYRTEYARKTGIRTDIIRGEDGYLALQLKQFGKIAFVRKRRARAVTGYARWELMEVCLIVLRYVSSAG